LEDQAKAQSLGAAGKVLLTGKNIVGKTLSKVADIYGISDNMLRVHTFLAHVDSLKQVHPDWTIRDIRADAARRAADETPTFARMTPAVKALSGVTGNFASWSSEVIRTTFNQVKNGINEVSEGFKTGNKKQIQYGVAQLSGTAAYLSAAKVLTPALVAWAIGTDKKDNEKANEDVKQLAGEYTKGNDLRAVEIDPKTHKVIFVNTSRVDPANPFNELYRRIETEIKKDGMKGIPVEVGDFIWDNFLKPGPAPQAFYQSATNTDSFGRPLPQGQRTSPIVKAFTPGFIKTQEMVNKIQARTGNSKLSTAKQLGIPLYELDGERSLKSRIYDFKNEITNAAASFKTRLSQPDSISENDLKSLYVDYLNKEKSLFDEAQRSVKAGKNTFGINATELTSLLKETKIDKDYRTSLMSGKFIPQGISDEVLETAKQKAIKNDPTRADEIKAEFNNRKKLLSRFRRNYQDLLD